MEHEYKIVAKDMEAINGLFDPIEIDMVWVSKISGVSMDELKKLPKRKFNEYLLPLQHQLTSRGKVKEQDGYWDVTLIDPVSRPGGIKTKEVKVRELTMDEYIMSKPQQIQNRDKILISRAIGWSLDEVDLLTIGDYFTIIELLN